MRLTLAANGARPAAHGPQAMGPAPLQAAPEPGEALDFDEAIRRHKKQLIAKALDENGGVMTRAAKALGLKYTTFVAMVHRLEILEQEAEPAAE